MSVTKFIKRAHCIALVMLCSFVLLGSPGILTRAVAQDSETVPASTEAPAAPTPAETEMPVEPAPPIPTEVPAPTDVPVIVDTPVPPTVAVPSETVPAVAPTVAVPVETPTETVTETEVVPTQVPPATPQPTVAPTVEPTPVTIWSQNESIQCDLRFGNVKSLAIGDSATWRCTSTIAADVSGTVPADLAILWTINATFAGDDVRFALPEGSLATIEQPDTVPGGTTEQVVYRTAWADGLTFTFDVVVTRTSCEFGDADLTLKTDVALKTADTTVVITQNGGTSTSTYLLASAAPNLVAPVVSMQPVTFEPLAWDGSSWGTSYGTSVVTVFNSGCPTSVAYAVVLSTSSSNPAMAPVLAGSRVSSGSLGDGTGTGADNGSVVANIPAGYQGEGTIELVYALTPPVEVGAGEYSFTFDVTTVVAP